jgi:hypothetical protein
LHSPPPFLSLQSENYINYNPSNIQHANLDGKDLVLVASKMWETWLTKKEKIPAECRLPIFMHQCPRRRPTGSWGH